MREKTNLGGGFTLAGTSLTVNRMGYGAMQLAGQDGDKRVWGPPRDIPGAIAVLREAVASGVNHIDTSDFYGPHVTNQIIKQALHPYPDDLAIVTKVGARRGADGSWHHARSRQEIIDAVHDNLRNLGLDALQVVNLRLGGFAAPEDEPFEEPLATLAELKRQGLVQHIGLSTVWRSAATTDSSTIWPPRALLTCLTFRSEGSRHCSRQSSTRLRHPCRRRRCRSRWRGCFSALPIFFSFPAHRRSAISAKISRQRHWNFQRTGSPN